MCALKPENLRQAVEKAETSGSPDTANARESLKAEEGETYEEAVRAGNDRCCWYDRWTPLIRHLQFEITSSCGYQFL